MNHPILAAAWLAVAGALTWTLMQGSGRGNRVSPAEATRLINSEDALVVDVRTDAEFDQGHIINAEHIPLADLSSKLKRLEKHRSRAVILACRTGQQSSGAVKVLTRAGFERVYNLAGGIAAWQDASLPLSKK